TILDTLAPIALRMLWRSHTGLSAASACSLFAASAMHSRKFPSSRRDKISPVAVGSASFPASAASPFPLLRMSIREFRNSGRRGFVRRDDTALSAEHGRECDARWYCRRDRRSGEIIVDRKFFHP